MYYPINLNQLEIFPIFGDQLQGQPHIFNYSSNNPQTLDIDTNNFDSFQEYIFNELEENNCTWGIGRYLEERKNLLRNYPQIIDEGRFYHLGLDIMVPSGYKVFAPIDGEVHLLGIEEGIGNYGGYVCLRHEINNTVFYSFYGHFNSNHLITLSQKISQGEIIGVIGEREDSGGWFTHTHLQIVSEKAMKEKRAFQAYISAENLSEIELLFPSPYPLFRY